MKENGWKEPGRPSRGEIVVRAFENWQKEGCPQGRYLHHWLWAVRQLEAERHPVTDFPQRKNSNDNYG